MIRILRENGWYQSDQKGSHRQFRHSVISGKVTLAGGLNGDIPKGTLKSILRQARMDEENA